MERPDGAIEKPWGWQLKLHADKNGEVWLGFGKRGQKTSLHCHNSFKQRLTILSGKVAVLIEDGSELFIPMMPKWKHRLAFRKDSLFVETYDRVFSSVADDICREPS